MFCASVKRMSKNISQKINTIPIIGEPVCLSTDAKVDGGGDYHETRVDEEKLYSLQK